ncbi:potassium transporter 5-like [Papaver somniferum]|uniref:potassium transporter 5-like n=1 Tax=Papaver somniferum TaxID=3469 RepID=UPI000E6FD772|nr:potassium transporter 5-like [Papaver somniferum]
MVLKAFNPFHIIQYFNQDPKEAWISLGGIILCMTGTEAMFVGHFSVRSIQICTSVDINDRKQSLIAFSGDYVLAYVYNSWIAVVAGELVTSSLLVLIMLMIWKTNFLVIVLFVLLFGSFELVYFSSVFYKFDKGGYLPLSFAGVLFFVMYVWHYVQTKRQNFEIKKQLSNQCLANHISDSSITRVPDVGLLFTESTHDGVPTIFSHLLSNLRAIHSVKRVMYKCVVRYGYRDTGLVSEEFEDLLMEYLKLFIQTENGNHMFGEKLEDVSKSQREEEEKEIEFLEESRKRGVTHMLGHRKAKASEGSCTLKRVIINNVYDFLETNFRQGFIGSIVKQVIESWQKVKGTFEAFRSDSCVIWAICKCRNKKVFNNKNQNTASIIRGVHSWFEYSTPQYLHENNQDKAPVRMKCML